MANSIIPGPLNSFGPWTPARTPGILGMNDQGDPTRTTLLGNTPGQLGFNDWADPNLRRLSSDHQGLFARSVRTDQGVALALAAGGAMPLMDDSLSRPITKEQLKKIFTSASDVDMNLLAAELNTDLVKCCLNTVLRRAHFFAQVREEIGNEMIGKEENLNYNPTVLVSLFNYYKYKPEEASADGYLRNTGSPSILREANRELIANKIYYGRNGNEKKESGDGWRFRGRGFMQITGRNTYFRVTNEYHKIYDSTVDFIKNPDMASKHPYGIRSAICFWVYNNMHKAADRGHTPCDVDQITKIINFKTKSYDLRRGHFLKAFNAFK